MLLRNVLATLLETLRLFQKPATWIALAFLLIVGVVQSQLRLAVLEPTFDGITKPSMVALELVTLFGFVGLLIVVQQLSRVLDSKPDKVRPTSWGPWLLICLGIFFFYNGVSYFLAYLASATVGFDKLLPYDSLLSGVLQWLIFLPFISAVLLARGSTDAGISVVIDRLEGQRVIWMAGFAILVILMTMATQLLTVRHSDYDMSETMLKLLSGFRFALTSLVPWLFAIAAANALAPAHESNAEVFH